MKRVMLLGLLVAAMLTGGGNESDLIPPVSLSLSDMTPEMYLDDEDGWICVRFCDRPSGPPVPCLDQDNGYCPSPYSLGEVYP